MKTERKNELQKEDVQTTENLMDDSFDLPLQLKQIKGLLANGRAYTVSMREINGGKPSKVAAMGVMTKTYRVQASNRWLVASFLVEVRNNQVISSYAPYVEGKWGTMVSYTMKPTSMRLRIKYIVKPNIKEGCIRVIATGRNNKISVSFDF